MGSPEITVTGKTAPLAGSKYWVMLSFRPMRKFTNQLSIIDIIDVIEHKLLRFNYGNFVNYLNHVNKNSGPICPQASTSKLSMQIPGGKSLSYWLSLFSYGR